MAGMNIYLSFTRLLKNDYTNYKSDIIPFCGHCCYAMNAKVVKHVVHTHKIATLTAKNITNK